MIYINVLLKVRDPGDIDKVRKLLSEQGRLSRLEPGCVRFEVYHSRNDNSVFVLNEHWESDEALTVHRLAHAYTTIYQPQVLPLVDRTPHPAVLVE